jgi:hypothetical protein
MKLEFSRQIFEKYRNIELHENSSSESQVAASGRADTTKLTVDFIFFLVLRTRPPKKGTPAGPTQRHNRATAPELTFCHGE